MGTAVWLFLWCIRCETPKDGVVLGGMPLTYAEIAKRSKFSERKVRRWMNALREYGYVEVQYLNWKMMRIIVNKSKKWHGKQAKLNFGNSGKPGPDYRPKTVNQRSSTPTKNGQSIRPKTVNRVTKNGQSKQSSSIRKIESSPLTHFTFLQNLQIPVSLWLDFKKMREGIHRPVLAGAEDLIARELMKLQNEGSPPTEVLKQAIMTASFMLYPVRDGKRHGKQIESFDERRRREARENIVAVLGNSSRPMVGAHDRSLQATAIGNQHRHVSGTLVGFEHGGTRRGVSARDSDVAVYADSRNDPERSTRAPGEGLRTIDVDPICRSSGDGTRIHSGGSESLGRISQKVRHNFTATKDSS